jgi:hypothetical protein
VPVGIVIPLLRALVATPISVGVLPGVLGTVPSKVLVSCEQTYTTHRVGGPHKCSKLSKISQHQIRNLYAYFAGVLAILRGGDTGHEKVRGLKWGLLSMFRKKRL